MKTITVIGTCLLILCFAAAGMSFAAEKGPSHQKRRKEGSTVGSGQAKTLC